MPLLLPAAREAVQDHRRGGPPAVQRPPDGPAELPHHAVLGRHRGLHPLRVRVEDLGGVAEGVPPGPPHLGGGEVGDGAAQHPVHDDHLELAPSDGGPREPPSHAPGGANFHPCCLLLGLRPGPVEEGLALHPALSEVPEAGLADLGRVAAEGPPAAHLDGVHVGVAPAEGVAAVPLEPASGSWPWIQPFSRQTARGWPLPTPKRFREGSGLPGLARPEAR